MPFSDHSITINTQKREIMIDITKRIEEIIYLQNNSRKITGICNIFIPHTTAGITINENSDPDVKVDFINIIGKLVPQKNSYFHLEGNSDAHVKASLLGFTQKIHIVNGKLQLGTWQGIMFCEFDGPRTRKINILIQN